MQKRGKNLDEIKDINRTSILRYLIQNEGCSRVDLSRATGLTQASITKIIRILIEKDVVRETDFSEGKKGRRSIGMALNYSKFHVIAIKLSWQKLKICVYDFRGKPQNEIVTIPIELVTAENIKNIVGIIADFIMKLHQEFPFVIGVGVAVPGPFQRDTGGIFFNSLNSSKGFYYPFREELDKLIELPVFTEYDASAGALGYWWCKTNFDNSQVFLHILASEGIGGGVVENGQIFAAQRGYSPEMGHITIDTNGRKCTCGSIGCPEAYCSSRAIEKRVSEKLDSYPDSFLHKNSEITIDSVFDAFHNNDKLAISIIQEACRYMGYTILSLLPVFDPDVVVVSDILSNAGKILLDEINYILDKELPIFSRKPQLVLTDPSEDLVLHGASAVAIEEIISNPSKYLLLEKEK